MMMGFEYNKPQDGIYQVSVDTAGAYSINNIKLGKYRMILSCTGSDFWASSDARSKIDVLGEIYYKGSEENKQWIKEGYSYHAQMSGFDVTVGKSPLIITRSVYGVYAGLPVN